MPQLSEGGPYVYPTWLPVINPTLQQVKLSEEVYYGEKAGITIPAPNIHQRFNEITAGLTGRLTSKTTADTIPKGEKNRDIRNAAILPVRPADRRSGTGREGLRRNTLAGTLLRPGLLPRGRPERAIRETPALSPELP